MKPALADTSARIAELNSEITALENAGPSLAERLSAAAAELAQARQHFEHHGFNAVGAAPSERLLYFRRAVLGALLTIDGDNKLSASERRRIERQHRERGGFDYGPQEAAERLRELRAERRRLEAAREIGWRQLEDRGEAVDRSGEFSPEAFLSTAADLAAIAAGQAPADTTEVTA